MKKKNLKTTTKIPKEKSNDSSQNKVKNNTGTPPERDTNPIPPNPNQVDNHDT